MLTLIEFLEELNQNKQTVVIPADEVERLAQRFGAGVRGMGFWNKAGDGCVEIPMSNIAEAALTLDNRALTEAIEQLRSPEQFTDMLNSLSAASQLIEALSKLYLQQFQRRVERFQDSNDPAEVERLRQKISQELFGA
jgi:predicted regulator of amino acid metabolism with ACT domain